VINLETPSASEQIRPPPRERVKPRAKNHVLPEGAAASRSSAYRLRVADGPRGPRDGPGLGTADRTGLAAAGHTGPTSTRASTSSSTHGDAVSRRNNPRDTAANIAVLLGALSMHSSSPARTQHAGHARPLCALHRMRLKRPDGHSQIAWQPRSARHRNPPKRPGRQHHRPLAGTSLRSCSTRA